MKKQFYSHIVEEEFASEVILELGKTSMSKKEKKHLESIFYSSIHTVVLDEVLTQLPAEHKKTFLTHVHSGDTEKIWQFLQEHTLNMEFKIANAVQKLTKEFLKDI